MNLLELSGTSPRVPCRCLAICETCHLEPFQCASQLVYSLSLNPQNLQPLSVRPVDSSHLVAALNGRCILRKFDTTTRRATHFVRSRNNIFHIEGQFLSVFPPVLFATL